MGGRERARQITRQLSIEDEEFRKAVDECNPAKLLMESEMNVFEKCGNCKWRYNCVSKSIKLLIRHTSIMDNKSLGDIEIEDLTDIIVYNIEFIMGLDREKKIEYFKGLNETLGIDLQEVLAVLDKVFSECKAYNKIVVDGFLEGDNDGN